MITDIPLEKMPKSRLCVIGSNFPYLDHIKSHLLNNLNCQEVFIDGIKKTIEISSLLKIVNRENKIDDIIYGRDDIDPFKFVIDLSGVMSHHSDIYISFSVYLYIRYFLESISIYLNQGDNYPGVILLCPTNKSIVGGSVNGNALVGGESIIRFSDLVILYDHERLKYGIIKDRYG